MKLIYLPLGVLVVLAIFSLLGLGTGTLGDINLGGNAAEAVYYDSGGHALVKISDLSAVGEAGRITAGPNPDFWARIADWTPYCYWQNATTYVNGTLFFLGDSYPMYYDTGAVHLVPWPDLGKPATNSGGNNVLTVSSSLGILALVSGIVALGAIVGIRIVGSGISEESVSAIIKGSAFLALWGVFSVLALGLISAGGVYLPIMYFILTLVYALGVVNQIGHPGAD